jgi:hypothetical protein
MKLLPKDSGKTEIKIEGPNNEDFSLFARKPTFEELIDIVRIRVGDDVQHHEITLILCGLVVGWSGVTDSDGNPLEFSKPLFEDLLCQNPSICNLVFVKLFDFAYGLSLVNKKKSTDQ